MNYLGDYATGSTVYVFFNTFDSAGASITLTGLAVTDVEIYKDGGTTQRASDSGYTLLDAVGVDFDSVTGIHGFSIDLSDNTTAGFFAAGSDYTVVVSSVTVDGQTVNFVAATFSIENRVAGSLGAQAKLDANAEADTAISDAALATAANLTTVDSVVDAIKAVTDLLPDGGALTTLLSNVAAILTDTGTTLPAQITGLNDPTAAAIADAVWDEVITGAQHNVQNSSARFLREASEAIALTGTAQSATASTLVLASGAVTADDIFNGERVAIIEGTGLGQSRLIVDSVASSDTVTVAHNWTTTPDSSSVYAIMGAEADVRAVAEQAVAATGAVDFDKIGDIATAAATSDAVWTEAIADHSGTVGSTAEALDAAGGGVTAAAIADAVWDEATADHTTSGSTGAKLSSLTAGSITYSGPVAPATGDVSIVIGDDYSNDDSRALEWTSASWPDLTGATSITLVVAGGTASDGSDWSVTVTAPTAGAGSQTIRAEPTDAETALLVEGDRSFQVEAVLASGNVVTLVDADWTSGYDIA